MIANKHTGETNCQNRDELAMRYFNMMEHKTIEENLIGQQYAKGNMGIVTLLSDLQHVLAFGNIDAGTAEHYRIALNDIKCVLINDTQRQKD